MKISIIIPILNEVDTVGNLLVHLTQSTTTLAHIAAIIVVDGGSTDGSQKRVQDIAKKNALVHIITAEKGRAKQMNAGACVAQGDVLYFLHADSYPPYGYDNEILKKVAQGHYAGCFCMRFDSTHWWLRLAGWLTQFNSSICRGGDQSLFITTSLFKELQGFDETFIICEDHDFIRKLYAKKKFVVIQKWLTTSARKYEIHGIWKLQYHFWVIYSKKWFGASAEALYQYYKKHIST